MSNCNISHATLLFHGQYTPRSITKLVKDQGTKIATAATIDHSGYNHHIVAFAYQNFYAMVMTTRGTIRIIKYSPLQQSPQPYTKIKKHNVGYHWNNYN